MLQTAVLRLWLSHDIVPSAWLNVTPSTSLSLHFFDQEFALYYWLGLQILEEGSSCPVCKSSADIFGDHQVGCGGNGDRILRHNAIRDAIFSAAQSAPLVPERRPPLSSQIPRVGQRIYFFLAGAEVCQQPLTSL